MQETNLNKQKNNSDENHVNIHKNNETNATGRYSVSARSPIHGRMSEDFGFDHQQSDVDGGANRNSHRTPSGSINSAFGNFNDKNHAMNSPTNGYRNTLGQYDYAPNSGNNSDEGNYTDHNEEVDEDDNVAQEEVKNFINRRLLYKQHLVLMLEIYPNGSYEYKEMSLRDLFDRINHHTMLLDAKLPNFDKKIMNNDFNYRDEEGRGVSSRMRSIKSMRGKSTKGFKKFYNNVDSTISPLRHRDLRRLEYSYKPVEEPAILIRRHVTLISLDPIRAAVMNDRMIMIVPQGADTLIEMLLQHLRYWAVDDDATRMDGQRTNGSTIGTNFGDSMVGEIDDDVDDANLSQKTDDNTAMNSLPAMDIDQSQKSITSTTSNKKSIRSSLGMDSNFKDSTQLINPSISKSKLSSVTDDFDIDNAEVFDASRVGQSFSEIDRDAEATKKKNKRQSIVMGAVSGITGLFSGNADNENDDDSGDGQRMTEDKIIAAAETGPKLMFRRASLNTGSSPTPRGTGASVSTLITNETNSITTTKVVGDDTVLIEGDNESDDDYSEHGDLISELPFEARCYEAILATVVCVQSDELSNDATLAAQIHKDLRNATIVTMTMQEHMRILKNRLSRLISTVAGDKSVLERIIDNDDYLCYLNLTDLADDPASYNSYNGPTGKIVKHREDMEALFESYFIDFTTLHSKISYIKSQLQTAEELMSLRLDTSRNQLLIADTTVSIVSMGLGLGAYIVGMFGMNLKSSVEEVDYWFMVVSIMTVFGIVGLAGGTIAYLKKQKILPHTRNNRSLKKYLKKKQTMKPKQKYGGYTRESVSFNNQRNSVDPGNAFNMQPTALDVFREKNY